MAEKKRSFPMLPVAHWWSLRKKFKQSIPGVVSDSYVAAVLSMEPNSARTNVLPSLKALGITDQEGRTTPRAIAWRDDQQYGLVCQEILKAVYPKELLEAVPDPSQDRAAAQRWFANHTGAGDAAAKRMTALYTVLVQADPSNPPESDKPVSKRRGEARRNNSKTTVTLEPATTAEIPPGAKPPAPRPTDFGTAPKLGPELNINLQIHISADASTDQIEQIFASMAKHIYKRS